MASYQTETEKRIGFSILFSLGGKYILLKFQWEGAKKIAIERVLW